MKILFLTHIFPTTKHPTRGTYNGNVFRGIARHCDIRMVCPVPWWNWLLSPADLLRAPEDDHIDVNTTLPTSWAIPRVTPGLNGQVLYLSLRAYIASLYKVFPFDMIVAAWAYPDAFAAARLAHDFGCPVVAKILGSDVNHLAQNPILRDKIRWALQQMQCVITVSAALKERVTSLGVPEERVVVKHNGVDGKAFAIRGRNASRACVGLNANRRSICYVGRFGHEKGVDVLLDAMKRLCDTGPDDIDLIMIGSGAMESGLRRQAEQWGIKDRVHFCGERSHDEIPNWISASDVFCLPSRREGCPNVILEALASGRPVVSARVGGVPELLNNENGIMVPSEDAEALAVGLKQALQRNWDPSRLRQSVEFLSWEEVGTSYYTELEMILHNWQATTKPELPVATTNRSAN